MTKKSIKARKTNKSGAKVKLKSRIDSKQNNNKSFKNGGKSEKLSEKSTRLMTNLIPKVHLIRLNICNLSDKTENINQKQLNLCVSKNSLLTTNANNNNKVGSERKSKKLNENLETIALTKISNKDVEFVRESLEKVSQVKLTVRRDVPIKPVKNTQNKLDSKDIQKTKEFKSTQKKEFKAISKHVHSSKNGTTKQISTNQAVNNNKNCTSSKQNEDIRRLRPQKNKNYADSPDSSSKLSIHLNADHIPIYMKNVSSKVTKKKTDIYEFNEPNKKKTNTNEKDSESDYDPYDKSLHELLKKLEKGKCNRRQNVAKKQGNIQILNAINTNTVSVINKNCVVPQNRKKTKTTNSVEEKIQNNQNKIVPSVLNTTNNIPHVQEDNIHVPQTNDINSVMSTINNIPHVQEDNIHVPRTIDINIMETLNINAEVQDNVSVFQDYEHSNDTNFSFSSSESDDQVDCSDVSINNITPQNLINANSNQSRLQPWRPEFPMLKRNPHLLYIKDTALPCKSQEMVLDFAMAEKFSPIHTTQIDEPNNFVQSSILNFVRSSKRNHETTVNNTTLFDCGDLSPIKLKKSPEKMKNVLKPIDCNVSPEKVKRNMLHSTLLQNTPKQLLSKQTKFLSKVCDGNTFILNRDKENILPNRHEKENVSPNKLTSKSKIIENSNFGFDESADENVGYFINRNDHMELSQKGPTRLSARTIKNILNENAKCADVIDVPNVEQNISIVENHNENADNSYQPKLFEDLEVTRHEPAAKSYKPKRQKRVRLPSFDSDNDIDEIPIEINVKKKKKDTRTKSEELAAEKWAQSFNELCEEIDKHDLIFE